MIHALFVLLVFLLILLLVFLTHHFFIKEKQKKWFAKYNGLFAIPVILCIIPICIFHNTNIKLYFLVLQWLIIGFQFLGLFYQRRALKILREETNKKLIEAFEKHKKWLVSNEYFEEAKKYQDMIDERSKHKIGKIKRMYISFLEYFKITK
jgi:NhaP-type Na+/H+ and K+/H+ antiporter